MTKASQSRSALETLEICANTLNHGFIAVATFYTCWYCINWGFSKDHTLHVFLASIGYILLMTEGILSMYNRNTFTLFMSRSQKTNIHWVLQAVGGGLGLAAFFLEVVQRVNAGKAIFHIWHARMGLASAICMSFSMLSGTSALFSSKFRNRVRPLYVKLFHNLASICAFVFGFIAMIIAYNTRKWVRNLDPGNIRYVMIGLLSGIMVLTLIGPLKTMLRQLTTFFRSSKEDEVVVEVVHKGANGDTKY